MRSTPTAGEPIEQMGELPNPPVDMEIFREIAAKEERIPDMANRYIKQAHEHLESLRKAIVDGDAENVESIAHKVAGSSAMCGMNPMVILLRELERIGHERQLAEAKGVFVHVEEEFARIGAFLANYPKTTNPAAPLAGIEEMKS